MQKFELFRFSQAVILVELKRALHLFLRYAWRIIFFLHYLKIIHFAEIKLRFSFRSSIWLLCESVCVCPSRVKNANVGGIQFSNFLNPDSPLYGRSAVFIDVIILLYTTTINHYDCESICAPVWLHDVLKCQNAKLTGIYIHKSRITFILFYVMGHTSRVGRHCHKSLLPNNNNHQH